MATILNGPTFIDFDAHMRNVQYRASEFLKKWMGEWAEVLGDTTYKIDIKWEEDLALNGYRMRVYVNDWVTNVCVDRNLFDHIHKDVHYLEYICEQVMRASQCGVIMHWLQDLYERTDDPIDLGKMWKEDVSRLIKEAYFQRTPSLGARADHYDLIHLIPNDFPGTITVTVKEVLDEPKLLMARLTMMKR